MAETISNFIDTPTGQQITQALRDLPISNNLDIIKDLGQFGYKEVDDFAMFLSKKYELDKDSLSDMNTCLNMFHIEVIYIL